MLPQLIQECYAMRRAMKFCNEMRMNQVISEDDAKMLLDVVQSKAEDVSWQGQVVLDKKIDLSTKMQWTTSFTCREGNKGAIC